MIAFSLPFLAGAPMMAKSGQDVVMGAKDNSEEGTVMDIARSATSDYDLTRMTNTSRPPGGSLTFSMIHTPNASIVSPYLTK
jgi:hypothetical protein